MNLPQELCEIVSGKLLWSNCKRYFPHHLIDAEIKAVKQRGWLHILEYDSESAYWAVDEDDIEILDWIADHHPFFSKNNYLAKIKNYIIEKGFTTVEGFISQLIA